MRAVAYLGFALLLTAVAPAVGAPATGSTAEPSPAAQAQSAPAPGTSAPSGTQAQSSPPSQAGAPPQTAAQQSAARAERRRNRTYARCNRAAINRGLHGGARRRFLIRCRLGYERGIGQPGQTAPAAPVRRP